MTDALFYEQGELLVAAISGGFIVICGAFYALLFAFYKLTSRSLFKWASYLSYLILFVSVLILSSSLHLTDGWISIVVVMIVGYWYAPKIIWFLCTQTHQIGGHYGKQKR